MMKLTFGICAFIFLTLPTLALAQGVTMGMGLTDPLLTIQNSDESKSHYSGFGMNLQATVPLISAKSGGFMTELKLSYRYLDLENTANDAGQKEFAKYTGPGAGLKFAIYGFRLGLDYQWVTAKHYWVGESNREIKFDFSAFNYYAGIRLPVTKDLNVEFLYSQGQGKIPVGKINSGSPSDFSEQIIWLNFIYVSNQSSGKFFGFLK